MTDKRRFQIVVPTGYIGSKEPKEPREGDIWQNHCTGEIKVFLGSKWFKVISFVSTGYTEQEEKEMQEKESIETKELERHKKILQDFKELLEEVTND